MVIILEAVKRTFSQLDEPALRRPFVLSILISLGIFGVLWFGAAMVLLNISVSGNVWLDGLMRLGAGLATALLALMLFPGVVVAVSALFLESLVQSVEDRYYPGLSPARTIPLGEAVAQGGRLLLVSVALNLLCLPLYLIPGVNSFVFPLLNGYLLGREYFELVASRRLDPDALRTMKRARSSTLWVLGAGFAGISLVPVLNFWVPALAATFFTHLFHLRSEGPKKEVSEPVL